MPAERHQHLKHHAHTMESSPGSDIKSSGHRATKSFGRVMSGLSGIVTQMMDYATPKKFRQPSAMEFDDEGSDELAPPGRRMRHHLPLSPTSPYFVSPFMEMVRQAVRDTMAKMPTPPRPRRPPTLTSINTLDYIPGNDFNDHFEFPKKNGARDGHLPSPISNPPLPRSRRRYNNDMEVDDIMAKSTYKTPSRRPLKHDRHSLEKLIPDIEIDRDDGPPRPDDYDASRPETQLHYFHEVLPHVCAAFAPVPRADMPIAPQHMLAMYPPLGKGQQTSFTHIIRLLYVDDDVGLGPGEGWVERYESTGRYLDVLKLVVPRDDCLADGSDNVAQKPQQTTLTANQLQLARDFLSLAKPCDEMCASPDAAGQPSVDYANLHWRDFSHVLICAPLHNYGNNASATREPDVFDDASAYHNVGIARPADQQRRNVLSIIAVYLSYASDHPVQSVWAMIMFHLKGECYGLLGERRAPKALRDNRETMRLWMGWGVESATGRRNPHATPKDMVLGVESLWPGWQVLREASAKAFGE